MQQLRVQAARHKRDLQRKAERAAGGSAVEIPEAGGSPLAGDVRGRMEKNFGADFSSVRVHTSGDSAKAADSLGARAFTDGKDVHFNAGQFSPGTKEGDRLLAHELTHVVQGQKSGIQRQAREGDEDKGGLEVSEPGDDAEVEADQKGDEIAEKDHADTTDPDGAGQKAAGDKDSAAGDTAAGEEKQPGAAPAAPVSAKLSRKVYREAARGGDAAEQKADGASGDDGGEDEGDEKEETNKQEKEEESKEEAEAPEEAPAAPVSAKLSRKIHRAAVAGAEAKSDEAKDDAAESEGGGSGHGMAKTKVVVNVRASAGGEKIGAIDAGTDLMVLAREGDWFKVQLPPGGAAEIGFVTAHAQFVAFSPVEEAGGKKAEKDKGAGEKTEGGGGILSGLAGAAKNLGKKIIKSVSAAWKKVEEGVDHLLEGEEEGTKDEKKDEVAEAGAAANTAKFAVKDAKAVIRNGPPQFTATSEVIPHGTLVDVLEEQTKNGHVYVKLQEHVEPPPGQAQGPPVASGKLLGWTAKSNLGSAKEVDPSMRPEGDKIDLKNLSGIKQEMAMIYNEKGGGLKAKAAELSVPIEGLAAVFHVEARGVGFSQDGRAIIRFENHKFHDFWGKDNQEKFDKHFRFDRQPNILADGVKKRGGAPNFQPTEETIPKGKAVDIVETASGPGGKKYSKLKDHESGEDLGWVEKKQAGAEPWTLQQFRKDENGQWKNQHNANSQDLEWEVLEFARTLSDEAALKSASYGGAQIMGFNFAIAGFSSVQAMYEQMSGAIKPHFDALGSFVASNPGCLEGLQNKDYVKFAKGYNGEGQANYYGGLIKKAAEAYAEVTQGLPDGVEGAAEGAPQGAAAP